MENPKNSFVSPARRNAVTVALCSEHTRGMTSESTKTQSMIFRPGWKFFLRFFRVWLQILSCSSLKRLLSSIEMSWLKKSNSLKKMCRYNSSNGKTSSQSKRNWCISRSEKISYSLTACLRTRSGRTKSVGLRERNGKSKCRILLITTPTTWKMTQTTSPMKF